MSGYFSLFPQVLYDFTINTDEEEQVYALPDLTTRVALHIKENDLNSLCDDYLIKEFETPTSIAYQLYNNVYLHWAILYINNIVDINSEWPMPQNAVLKFTIQKYGQFKVNSIHHYENSEGLIGDVDFLNEKYGPGSAMPVTNFEYEIIQNELRRNIKVIKPLYISAFIKSFKDNLVL